MRPETMWSAIPHKLGHYIESEWDIFIDFNDGPYVTVALIWLFLVMPIVLYFVLPGLIREFVDLGDVETVKMARKTTSSFPVTPVKTNQPKATKPAYFKDTTQAVATTTESDSDETDSESEYETDSESDRDADEY